MGDERRLAVGVIALAAAVTALQVLRSLSSFAALDDIQRAHATGTDLSPFATGYGRAGLGLALVLVAAWVVTCRWLVHARTTAEQRNFRAPLGLARPWVWHGWWVPVVSLWFPRRVMVDLMAAHRVPPRRDHPDDLGRWWAGWVVWLLATAGAVGASRVADTPGTLVSVPVLEAIATWGLVAAAVPWCRLVHALSEAQRPHPERIEV